MALELEAIESAVLRHLLAGASPILEALRRQLEGVVVSARYVKRGFFTYFSVSPDAPRLNHAQCTVDYVIADVEGLKHGSAFALFTREGALHNLGRIYFR